MASVLADTHALVWYLQRAAALSPGAHAAIQGAVNSGGKIHVSAISLAELI